MMISRRRPVFHLLFLGVFLSLTLFINFFHTEHSLNGSNTCPACQFQNSTLTTSQINFFQIPQLFVLDTLRISEFSISDQARLLTPSSRSPPSS